MRIKRPLTAILLLLALALVVSACADDDATDDAPDAESEEAEEAIEEGDTVISLARFFGDCDESTEGVTDVAEATDECEVIQILTNAFNEEDNGVFVERLGGAVWDQYYTQLSTTFASGNPPQVAVMHSHRLPDFAGRDLLRPIDDDLDAVGVDFTDYTEPAQEGAAYEGDVYAVPFDIHGSLWHVNVDLFEEAGLVDGDGEPIMPTSIDELFEQAETIQSETDAMFFSQDWFEFQTGGRLFLGLVAQQGGSLIDDDLSATVDTPEGEEALRVLNELADTASDPSQGYTDSQSEFLAGNVAVLHNGTWVVDQYVREAEFEYRALELPVFYEQPGFWGDSHMWVLPAAGNEDDELREASLEFVSYLYDSVGDWAAGTGHLANRTSVLTGGELDDAPQRDNYADAADTAVFVPAVAGWAGAWDALADELQATWVGDKDPAVALAAAEARMNEELGTPAEGD
ncbi:MAG: extracellular solute-binding protein [Egibacteraceae bacterium]